MNRIATLLATCFGIGRIPGAPGTAASLAALPVGWWLAALGNWQALLAASIVITLVGIWACGRHAIHSGIKDPGECVLDEVAGQWFALVPLAAAGRLASIVPVLASIIPVVLAFALFRFFDVLKPWPIGRFERLPGGLGIMADDVVSGLVAAGLLWAALQQNWI